MPLASMTPLAIALLLVFAPLASQAVCAKEALIPTRTHGGGELRSIGNVPVAILAGSPEQIGEQYAMLVGKPGAPLLKFTRKMLDEVGQANAWPMVVHVSRQLLQRAPQRYQTELAAAIEHAQADSDEMFVANALLELRRLGCSTLIVEPQRSATGSPIFGRNFDFPSLGMLNKYSVLTIVRPEGKRAFASVGFPGLIGVISGMNDAGLAIATLDVEASSNGSPQLDPTGTPMMLVFRQILEECSTVGEAEALLRRSKLTTWANLAVCDREGGAVFELTPTEIARRNADDGLLPCTNHFRSAGFAANTECTRYASLLTAASSKKLDVEAVHQHLDRANQGELTMQTMVFQPRELVLHLAIGSLPTSKLRLVRIDLKELLSAQQ